MRLVSRWRSVARAVFRAHRHSSYTSMADASYEDKSKQVVVIARPLASEKLSKKLLKLCKKATKKKQVKRGVKEVVKAVRKKNKGCACDCSACMCPLARQHAHAAQAPESFACLCWAFSQDRIPARQPWMRVYAAASVMLLARGAAAGARGLSRAIMPYARRRRTCRLIILARSPCRSTCSHTCQHMTGRRACRLIILAGDISPIDVLTHVPVVCEDHDIPYVYVPSKEVRALCKWPRLSGSI
jgi:ribosomal protein L7Ae-like RNA K-turn-binding protein